MQVLFIRDLFQILQAVRLLNQIDWPNLKAREQLHESRYGKNIPPIANAIDLPLSVEYKSHEAKAYR